jgi:hypothetical protein
MSKARAQGGVNNSKLNRICPVSRAASFACLSAAHYLTPFYLKTPNPLPQIYMKNPSIPPLVRKSFANLLFDNVTKKLTLPTPMSSDFQRIANAIENLLGVAVESRSIKRRRAVARWSAIVKAELQKEAAAATPRTNRVGVVG